MGSQIIQIHVERINPTISKEPSQLMHRFSEQQVEELLTVTEQRQERLE
jgi:hypothetical protein